MKFERKKAVFRSPTYDSCWEKWCPSYLLFFYSSSDSNRMPWWISGPKKETEQVFSSFVKAWLCNFVGPVMFKLRSKYGRKNSQNARLKKIIFTQVVTKHAPKHIHPRENKVRCSWVTMLQIRIPPLAHFHHKEVVERDKRERFQILSKSLASCQSDSMISWS